MPPHLCLHTPLGPLTIFEGIGPDGAPAIVAVEFGRGGRGGEVPTPATPLLRAAAEQLQDYFDGRHPGDFGLPLAPHGTAFQRRVWDALRRIPPGETRSYADVGRTIGCRAARAVGQANGRNPIPILIPCHRVVAADGSLGGYSGGEGPATKRHLLDLERRSAALLRAAA